jgi:hypothetical protein
MKKARRAKRPGRQSGARPRRAAGGAPTGCKYETTWSPLSSTRGYVQVWVPEKAYDRAAKSLLKATRDRYPRMLLRRRMAPLGVVSKCTGTCSGGWCGESETSPGTFVCECKYFV